MQTQLLDFINYVPKRIRIVSTVIAMTVLVLLSTFVDFADWWWVFIPLLLICAFIGTYVSVFEGIHRVEWFMLFVMPVIFTVAFYLFFTLLPARWLTRLPYIAFYAFAFYAILLTSNIFNVGVEKSLQLYRAAFSVNFLFQTLIIFLVTQVIVTFNLNFIFNSLAMVACAFPIATQLYWTLNPVDQYQRENVVYGILTSVLIFELAAALSFIPFKPSIVALIITASYYSLTGLLYHYLDQRLFKSVVREYLFVIVFVTIIALLTLQW